MAYKYNVGVMGATGRMGQEIANCLKSHDTLNPYLGWSRSLAPAGFKYCSKNLHDAEIANVDVWIDFSLPEALSENINIALVTKKPFVCGTTGLTDAQLSELGELSKVVPVVWSPNMSLGINLLLKAIENLKSVSNFDFQIEEIHHNRKLDRPSGTAIALQKKLVSTVGKDIPNPVSIRGGGIFGDHRVMAFSEDEMLVFEHRALSRRLFAQGAVIAAEWILNEGLGLYSMQDVLFG